MIDIIEHEGFPAVDGKAYALTTRDSERDEDRGEERGEDMALRWAKQLGAEEVHRIPQSGDMVMWKVSVSRDTEE